MNNVTSPKPCGNYHPLPCGLDVDCKVPVRFFETEREDEEVVEEYEAAIG